MVVICPGCKTRLKIDDSKISPRGSRFKCPKCSTTVFVKQPETTEEIQKVSMTSAPTEAFYEKTDLSKPQEKLNEKKILVAHGDPAILEKLISIVSKAGYIPISSNDGIDAIIKASKELPHIAVLDVALPKEYGFNVCQKIKEIEYTKNIKVILITSVYDKRRYKRPPESLYGADDYVEEHAIEEELPQKIEAVRSGSSQEIKEPEKPPLEKEKKVKESEKFLKELTSFEPLPESREKVTEEIESYTLQREIQPTPPETPEPPKTISPDITDEAVEKARRLARTIVSDIYFYNPKKVEDAIRSGMFYEVFKDELSEGMKLYESRVPPDIRKKADYFKEEIEKFISSKKKMLNI